MQHTKVRCCRTCGTEFPPGQRRKSFCNVECRPECSFPGCENKIRGLQEICEMHYMQRLRGISLKPSAYAPKGTPCVVCGGKVQEGSGRRRHCSSRCQQMDFRHKGERPGQAICVTCEKPFELGIEDGGRFRRTDTKYCQDCGRESPHARRFKRYGVTKAQFDAACERGCEICGVTGIVLHIDHDHSCCPQDKFRTCGKCVRGFLCGNCNRALGMLRDDPEIFRRAASYLE